MKLYKKKNIILLLPVSDEKQVLHALDIKKIYLYMYKNLLICNGNY